VAAERDSRKERGLSDDGPIRRFVRRLRYRDQVLEHLGALLLMYPRGRQFADDFPGLRASIRTHFEEGAAPSAAALKIAADILSGLLHQLSDLEKRGLLSSLANADPVEAKALASRRLARAKTDAANAAAPTVFAGELASVAIFMAWRMSEEGTLRREEVNYLLRTIEEALGAEAQLLKDGFARNEDIARL
jgi:hypothetical protein